MRVIIVGYGIQGHKRHQVAGDDVVSIVDITHKDANYKSLKEVPLDTFDAAIISTPDEAKIEAITYLLKHHKHVLVEKPLLSDNPDELLMLQALARQNSTVCYSAYNHRFEPHIMRMKNVLTEKTLGEIYAIRLFYGNGTARLVRNSLWRDQGTGVLPDLGSHLLDTILYWIEEPEEEFKITAANCFENRAFDHVIMTSNGSTVIQLEMSLLSWRNDFSADIYGEFGSAHIHSLCKWGPSSFKLRLRKLPSGKPDEDCNILTQDDPTWAEEYTYFKSLCTAEKNENVNHIEKDIWINDVLSKVGNTALEMHKQHSQLDQAND